jgi:aminodeoxyfutalosine deaminase
MSRESYGAFRRAALAGIDELQACGIDTIGDITYTGASIDAIEMSGLSGTVFCEVQGFGRRGARRFEMVKGWIARHRGRAGQARMGLSLHSPYSCEPRLIREAAAWARRRALPMAIHVAESVDEVALVRDHTGLLRDELRFPIAPESRGRTPVEWLSDLGALSPGWLVVHAIHVSCEDVDRLADSGCVVVHCPRSNANLGVGRMPLERFAAAGVEVVLGTDSRASAPSLSVEDELAATVELHTSLSKSETIAALSAWKGF